MLSLIQPTDPRWVDVALADVPALLSDHAHCELKAAQSALSLLARYAGEVPALVAPLGALVREESEHFAQVHEHMSARGVQLGLPSSDAYVAQLMAAARENHHDDHPALLDRLLVSALIEGRSCERFRILSEHAAELSLASFYRALMAAEAKHFTLFCDLAAEIFGKHGSRSRLQTLAAREGAIVAQLPLGPQVHG